MYDTTSEVSIFHVLGIARYFKRPAMLVMLALMVITVFGNQLILPDTYEATGLIRVKNESLDSIESEEPDTRYQQPAPASTNEIISYGVVLTTVDQLGLTKMSDKPSLIGDVAKFLKVKRKPVDPDLVVRDFQELIKVGSTGTPEEGLFTVSFVDQDPFFPSKVVNTLINTFANEKRDRLVLDAESTMVVLKQQLAALDEELVIVKKDIGAFAGTNAKNLVPRDQLLTMLQEAKTSTIESHSRIRELEEQERGIRGLLSAESAYLPQAAVAEAASDPNALPADALLERKRNELVNLETRLLPNHPDIVILKKDIVKLEQVVKRPQARRARTSSSSLANPEYQRLKSELVNIQAALAAAKSQVGNLDSVIGESQTKLSRSHNVDNVMNAYGSMQDKLQISRVNLQAKLINATVTRSIALTGAGGNVDIINNAPEKGLPRVRSRFMLHVMSIGASIFGGLLIAGCLSYLFLVRLQKVHGPVRSFVPDLEKIAFTGYTVDESSGTTCKTYSLIQAPRPKMTQNLVLAAKKDTALAASPVSGTFAVEPRVEPLYIGDVCAINLFENQQRGINKVWWFIPLMILGFGSVITFVVIEFLRQFFIL